MDEYKGQAKDVPNLDHIPSKHAAEMRNKSEVVSVKKLIEELI